MTSRNSSRGSVIAVLLVAIVASLGFQRLASASPTAKSETAVFAGGCFWGIQAVFQHTKGVTSAVSGYAGGWTDKPSYEMVSSGTTGHAESVRVTYDPAQVSYSTLLKTFFAVAHDPTQLNRQGPDVGTQYRSAIFFMTPEQKQEAAAYIEQMDKAHVYGKPIVTQVVAYKAFFPAEDYHQDYARHNPSQPYIAFHAIPKACKVREKHASLMRPEA